MNRYIQLILAAVMLIGITGCASRETGQRLAGQVWIATTLGGKAILPDTTITAEFMEDASLSGSNGCNRYNTTYSVEGDNLTINQPIMSTLMACPDPVMAQEQAYIDDDNQGVGGASDRSNRQKQIGGHCFEQSLGRKCRGRFLPACIRRRA